MYLESCRTDDLSGIDYEVFVHGVTDSVGFLRLVKPNDEGRDDEYPDRLYCLVLEETCAAFQGGNYLYELITEHVALPALVWRELLRPLGTSADAQR